MTAPVASCARCSAQWPAAMKFCGSCGAPMAPAGAGARKTVTAVFCDVVGSTAWGQRLDPESVRAVMESYFAAVSAVLTRHGGTVEKFVGDAVMAVFGVPVAHEDDALRACRAVVEMQAAVADLDERVAAVHGARFAVRVGMETGEVLVGDPARGSTFASGAPVNLAARLEQAAGPGECLIGADTYRLVRDLVDVEPRPGLELKGISEPITGYSLVALRDPRTDHEAGPMVGRRQELAVLQQGLDRAVSDPSCQVITVLGAAGVGKSRLAADFVSGCSAAVTVLRGRCVSYGQGATYWPLVQVVRQAAALTGGESQTAAQSRLAELVAGDPDAEQIVGRLAAMAGWGGVAGSVAETAWAFQRLLERRAAVHPLLLIIDDLHWAEPGVVEIVQHVSRWSTDAAILILVLARPELADRYPGWVAAGPSSVAVPLEPLADDEVDQLTADLLGGALPAEVAERVRMTAGGNPLFVEQLLAMLVEEGALQRDGDRWLPTTDLRQLSVPPTIAALLGARLDLLSASERTVLAAAAVMGQVFYRTAVAELAQLPPGDAHAHLEALGRKGLIRPAGTDLPGEDALSFAHVLVRDAAYRTLLKATRADLHERFARWLDRHTQGPAYDAFVGDHLEQAFRHRADLGALDPAARRLGDEAADRLLAAGRQLIYADERTASALLERAGGLRTDAGPHRWAVLGCRADALIQATDYGRATAVSTELLAGAEAAGDHRWAAFARLQLAFMRQATTEDGAPDTLRREAERALVVAGPGDYELRARAHEALSTVFLTSGQFGEQARQLQAACQEAVLAGDHRLAGWLRRVVFGPLIHGDYPARSGLAYAQSALATATDRLAKVTAANAVAYFARQLGRADEAFPARQMAHRLAHESRRPIVVAGVAMDLGEVEMTAGDLGESLQILADGGRAMSAVGNLSMLATLAALHAHALLHADQIDAARSQVATALGNAAAEDAITHGLAAAASAWLAGLAGDAATVDRSAASAVTLLEATDALEVRAIARVACAEAASVVGDRDAVARHRSVAVDDFAAKGNVVAADRQRALL